MRRTCRLRPSRIVRLSQQSGTLLRKRTGGSRGQSAGSAIRSTSAGSVGPSSRVGVIGLGGLGHMAVKLAAALGAKVTVIFHSPGKREKALETGADAFLLSSDDAAMAQAANGFDLIIDTVPVAHPLDRYTPLLDIDGTLAIVGQVGPWGEVNDLPLLMGRRRIAGSLIGGIKETQEVLDFCAREGILPECQMIRPDEINDAFARLEKGDLPYRFVMDMAALPAPQD